METVHPRIALTPAQLEAFCRKWKIERLELFGSALRDDFSDDSDLDFLATFEPGVEWSFHDDLHMQEELAALVGRPVDLVERRLVEASRNYIRRRSILNSALALYAA